MKHGVVLYGFTRQKNSIFRRQHNAGGGRGAKAVNFGVGGTRIAPQITPSAEAFCDEYFLLRAKKMDKDADLVVVFGGTNDFGHGDAPFGRIGDKDPATFCGAETRILPTGCIPTT